MRKVIFFAADQLLLKGLVEIQWNKSRRLKGFNASLYGVEGIGRGVKEGHGFLCEGDVGGGISERGEIWGGGGAEGLGRGKEGRHDVVAAAVVVVDCGGVKKESRKKAFHMISRWIPMMMTRLVV